MNDMDYVEWGIALIALACVAGTTVWQVAPVVADAVTAAWRRAVAWIESKLPDINL